MPKVQNGTNSLSCVLGKRNAFFSCFVVCTLKKNGPSIFLLIDILVVLIALVFCHLVNVDNSNKIAHVLFHWRLMHNFGTTFHVLLAVS